MAKPNLLGLRLTLMSAVVITLALVVGGYSFFPGALGNVVAAPSPSAATSSWSGSIAIQNNGTSPANTVVDFYSPSGVQVKSYALSSAIPPKGSITLDTASIPDLPTGFLGSAVISATEPVTAAFIGFDASNPDIDRTIYTGFADGSPSVYVPAISNAYADQTSTLAVQNIESGPVSVTISYYERFTGALSATVTDSIPASSSHYFDSSSLPGGQKLTPPWSGAALVQASGRVVAAVHQPYLSTNKAVSYEGQVSVGTTAFLPTALFQYAVQKQTTFIAVQNTQAAKVSVEVNFYDKGGVKVGGVAGDIEGFKKSSWNPGSAGIPAGYIGSAVVKASSPVAVVVNIGSDTDLAMSFDGVPSGYTKVALPYVRWSPQNDRKGWRTYIAVMNTDQDNPADIVIRYYDPTGALVNTSAITGIAPNTKGNHNSGVFVGEGGIFVGSVEIESNTPIAALVNAITVDGASAGSYTGVPIQ